MVSVYDSATCAYMRPFQAQTEGQAIRSFTDETLNPESPMSKHPQDYSLFKVADWNDADGTMVPEVKCLARAHEVLAAQITENSKAGQ